MDRDRKRQTDGARQRIAESDTERERERKINDRKKDTHTARERQTDRQTDLVTAFYKWSFSHHMEVIFNLETHTVCKFLV